MKATFYTILCVLFMSVSAHAVPYLQLDADPSVYDDNPDVETVIATEQVFTLYALVDPDTKDYSDYSTDPDNPKLNPYYISAALITDNHEGIDKVSEDEDPDFGFFYFDGKKYNFVGLAEYGTPPVDIEEENADLAGHGIFKTYYYEFFFEIDEANVVAEYNSQDNPGGFDTAESDDFLYYAAFAVDVSHLADGYQLHFDLYTIDNDGKIIKAPFSHDAESGGTPPGSDNTVPEPATLFLFGLGLLGMAGTGRKKMK